VCEAFPTGVAARNVGLYALKNDVAGGSLWQDEACPHHRHHIHFILLFNTKYPYH
jgi:hypothetical protein